MIIGRKLDGCDTGDAKLTRGYELPAWVLPNLFTYLEIDTIIAVLWSTQLDLSTTRGTKMLEKNNYPRAIQGAWKSLLSIIWNLLWVLWNYSHALKAGSNLCMKAFCCISTGVYGYPHREAAGVALSTIRKFLDSEQGEKVRMVPCIIVMTKSAHVDPWHLDWSCRVCRILSTRWRYL